MAGNLLFDMLSKEARRAIFASMEPLVVSAGTQIITQVRRLAAGSVRVVECALGKPAGHTPAVSCHLPC